MKWEEECGKQYRMDYLKNNYDRFSVLFPKGKKADYMKLAEENGMKLNEFINKLLSEEEKKKCLKNSTETICQT